MSLLKFILIALFLVGTQLTVACGGDAETPADETEATDDGAADTEAGDEATIEE